MALHAVVNPLTKSVGSRSVQSLTPQPDGVFFSTAQAASRSFHDAIHPSIHHEQLLPESSYVLHIHRVHPPRRLITPIPFSESDSDSGSNTTIRHSASTPAVGTFT